MDLKKINTFIFDMDGTIIDAEKLNISGYTDTIKNFFNIEISHDDYQKYFSGTKTAKAFEGFLQSKNIDNYNTDDLVKYFRVIKRKNLIEEPDKVLTIFPYVKEFLQSLKGRKVILATSTISEFTQIILKHFDIYQYFNTILTAEDIKEGKPNPEIYLKALEISKSEKETSVIFEDSKSGIEAALNSGIYCIGIHTKGLNDDYVNTANEVIESYQEVISRLI